MPCERGYTKQLPDLAVWLKRSAPPVAVIAESGGRREDRQKMILEGWRDGILSGRYAGVQYHCSNESVAHWISRLAKKVRVSGPAFFAAAQMSAEEIAALPRAAAADDELPGSKPDLSAEAPQPRGEHIQTASIRASPPPAPVQMKLPDPRTEPEPETSEEAAERERRYREIFGIPEPRLRRRWRR
jgi:hypothetical protein